jgi:hypothetical protein
MILRERAGYCEMSGLLTAQHVEVHANALWTILAGFPLKSAGTLTDIALILALIAITAVIGIRKSGLVMLAAGAGLLAAFVVSVQLAFDAGWIVTVTYPIIGLATTPTGNGRRGRLHGEGVTRSAPTRTRRPAASHSPPLPSSSATAATRTPGRPATFAANSPGATATAAYSWTPPRSNTAKLSPNRSPARSEAAASCSC